MKFLDILQKNQGWNGAAIPENILHGDMPGDKIQIGEEHIRKADVIFKQLLKMLPSYMKNDQKIVISVCGGSGVGKSETASLLTYYFNEIGINSYTLSGDNYPHRIPQYNDAERLQVYREGGVLELAKTNLLKKDIVLKLQKLQEQGLDSAREKVIEYDWLKIYQMYGKDALSAYLGTEREIGFEELSKIIFDFKSGANEIYLRRMGRTNTELWYDLIDFSNVHVLIIEWTHGNSDYLKGVDIPILLNSTPEETLAHRRFRNRDGAVDSSFVQIVLEIEQEKLKSQAHKAKIILSKDGEIWDYKKYCAVMGS